MDTIGTGMLHGVLFISLIIISCQITCVKADAKLSIKFIRYENPFKLKYDLRCCDGELRGQQCTGGCDHNVRVCIDSLSEPSTCSLASEDLGGVAFNEANFDFPSFFLGGLPNPFPISLQNWQGGVQVRVSLYDGDTGPDELIDEFLVNFTQPSPKLDFVPNSSFYDENKYNLEGERPVSKSSLSIAIEVYCDANFYGDDCSTNCVPENDCLGHYSCNTTTGDKICLLGWAGQNCNVKVPGVEDCLPSQSCNSGTCVPQGGNSTQFYCCCEPGFTGDLCDIDINECLSMPCRNGGICSQDRPDSFQCTCSLLFTGPTCERQKTCDDNPCRNNGFCIPLNSSNFQCACSDGATGDFCENSITTSTSTTSSTVPTTVSTVSTTTTSNNRFCPPDLYGPSCEVFCKADDTCDSGYFTCHPQTGGKICSDGWRGLDCTIRDESYIPDAECPESTCRNSGVCKNSTCCCAQGFTGRLCHIEILECDSSPCINGGRCRDRIGDFQCECADGYTGRNCEVIIFEPPFTTVRSSNPCDSISCDNGGICLNDNRLGPLCLCPRGYYGPSCRDATNTITNTVCQPNMYGTLCDTFCRPENSCTGGHYDCHYSTGEKICLAGWTGPNCQKRFLFPDTDPDCPASGCRNGGLCNNGSCCCPLGYDGEFCQDEVFECSRKPCLNNGRCVELATNGFRCECPTGFTGDECELIPGVTSSPTTSSTGSSGTSTTSVTTGYNTTSNTTATTTARFDITSTISSVSNRDFVGRLYLLKWWKFLREEQIMDIIRDAIYARNFRTGITEDSIQITTLEQHDALDQRGRNVAELTYNASLVSGFQGPLLPPTLQSLEAAIETRGYNIKIYDGPTPWRYIYHYDLYYKAKRSETTRSVITKLNSAWLEKYTEYKDCDCIFVIRIPRRVRYLDRSGSIITRYIYFVLVDGRPNDPAVQPGPSIPELVQYFVGPDGDTVLVSKTNLTQYEEHHEIYLTGNVTDTEQLEIVIESALKNTTSDLDGCGTISVNVTGIENQFDTNGELVSKIMYTVYCDEEPVAPADNTSILWDIVDEILAIVSDGQQSVYRNTTELIVPSTTPVSVDFTSTMSSSSIRDFVGRIYLLRWWKFLSDTEVTDILRDAIYLSNLRSGIRPDSIQITTLEKYDALNQRGRNVAELMYNASLVSGFQGPLLPPSLQSLEAAIVARGYNIKIYDGPTPWRYIYHYDLYYKAGKSETLGSVIAKLNRAWMDKYPEYLDCGCTFVIRVPRRVRYLDISGSIITRYIYFVLVDGRLNDPAVQPGPSIPELVQYFVGPDGDTVIVSKTNLTEYEEHHEIYLTGNVTDTESEGLENVIKTALLNSTTEYDACVTLDVNVARTELLLDPNEEDVTKIMYTVYCDDESVAPADNTSILWDIVDEILVSEGDGQQSVYRNTTGLIYPTTTSGISTTVVETTTTTAPVVLVTSQTMVTDPSTVTRASSMTTESTTVRTSPMRSTSTSRETTKPSINTTPVISTVARYFNGTLYLYKWWRYLSETQAIDVLRIAIHQTNIQFISGLRQDSIMIADTKTYDAMDASGRNVAELTYNASLVPGFQGRLIPPTLQSLEAAVGIRGYNIKIYDGAAPWRYIYHYDLYYKAGKAEPFNNVIIKLNRAWVEKYPEYQSCECEFTIRVPRQVRYLDRNGAIVTRYIYFVFVDGSINDPAVQPGPSIPDLVQYFVGPDGDTVIVSKTNLTEYEEHHEIYLTGNVTDTESEGLENVIKTALLNSTTAYRTCMSLKVNVARTELQIDVNGRYVSKLMFTVDCDSQIVEPMENDTALWNAVDAILSNQGPNERQVYRFGGRLFYPSYAYTLFINGDFIGDLERAILETWKTESTEIKNCNCQVTVNIVRKEQYVGVYGIQTTGIMYFMTKLDEMLDPNTSPAPSRESFQAAIRDSEVYNTVYKGDQTRLYSLYYSLLTKSVLGKERQMTLKKKLSTTAWRDNLPASLRSCSDCSLRVNMARPEIYYTTSGEMLYRGLYSLNWGGNAISPLQTSPPSDTVLARDGLNPCGCQGLRRRHVDVKGRLSYLQIQSVREKIGAIWRQRNAAALVDFKEEGVFVDSDSNAVTRVYFTVRDGERDSSVSVFELSSLIGVSTQLSPFEPIVGPSRQVYHVYLWGTPNEDTPLSESIKKAWLEANTEIAVDAFAVIILDQDGDFTSGDNGESVTKAEYTVNILDADSSIVNVEEPSSAMYESTFGEAGIKFCGCVARKLREFYITGSLDNTDDESLQDVVSKAWKENNPDFSGTLTTAIISKNNGFQSSNEDGTKLTRVVYTVTPDADRPAIRSTALDEPENSQLNEQLQIVYPELTTYDGDIIKEKVESSRDWIIPVVVVICLLLLVIIVVIIILVIRNRRNRKSRTLKRNPNEIRGFDKEHFSTEPEFENPAFDASEVNQKNETQYMNMSQ